VQQHVGETGKPPSDFTGSARGGIRSSPNHLDQIFEMMRVDKTDDSSGIAAQRLYVDHAAATRAYLDALIFICPEVKRLVTDRASKSYFFSCWLLPLKELGAAA